MLRARVWLAFAALCMIWGASYLFIRLGVRDLTPPALVALRLLVGAAVISTIATVRRHDLRLQRREFLVLLVIATINTVAPFLLIAWGEVTVPSGLAAVLNSTVPIFSMVLAGAVLQDEPMTLPRLSGVAVGFTGVVVLLSKSLSQSTIHWSALAGQGAIVLASVCYAVGAVSVRKSLRGVPPLTMATYTLLIAAGETVIFSLLFSRPAWGAISGATWFAIGWLGILGSGVAYLLAFYILSNWGAARYSLLAYMMPVVGLTLGAVFLHEVLDWHIIAGSILVVSGVLLASLVKRANPLRGEERQTQATTAAE